MGREILCPDDPSDKPTGSVRLAPKPQLGFLPESPALHASRVWAQGLWCHACFDTVKVDYGGISNKRSFKVTPQRWKVYISEKVYI